ncbi:MAG: DUF2490 domain-containing protein [Pseudomonadota bacterium]
MQREPRTLYVALLCAAAGGAMAQEVTPETPSVSTDLATDIAVELLYLGVSKNLTEGWTGQLYAAYGIDDSIGLGVLDLAKALNDNIQLGGRYQFLGADGSSDQHTFWGYLNAQRFFGQSWRLDTRQVLEQRLNTSGVNERTRYRPRFRVSYFGDMAGVEFQLYASVEQIFNLTDDDDNQTSWASGLYFRLNKHFQINAFHQWTETERGPDFRFPGVGLVGFF